MNQLALDLGNQRWRAGRASYRRPTETIQPSLYDVALIDRSLARGFVEQHHYSRTFPPARFRVGLFERGELVGVAAYSVPQRDEVTANVFPTLPADARVELGRFVLLDRVPGNGETWFRARADELVSDHGIAGVVAFSDPVPRTAIDGRIVMPGHIGTIYQAGNAVYRGRGSADTLRLLPDGRSFARRSYQKIRSGERGWRPCAAVLENLGADAIAEDADEETRRAWLDLWMGRLTRPLRHPGNHRYAWITSRRHRRSRPQPTAPYPKYDHPQQGEQR